MAGPFNRGDTIINKHFTFYFYYSQKDRKLFFKTNYRLMQAKSQGEHSAILMAFIKLSIVIDFYVVSTFEWPFYTGFTV